MMTTTKAILIVLLVGVITFGSRLFPFLFFRKDNVVPDTIIYLGKVLPLAIMPLLLTYSFQHVTVTSAPFAIPELLASIGVILLHAWKRNTLLSISVGTMLYMVMVNIH